MRQVITLFLLFFSLYSQQAAAQTRPVAGLSNDEHLSLVGIMLPELIQRFGPPGLAVVERGIELWQDDVVFKYNGADFYIYRDRVWQVKLASTHGISNGDRKAVVLLTFGNRAADYGDHVLLPVNSRDWPLMLRVNFSNTNNTETVTEIYIYRPDF